MNATTTIAVNRNLKKLAAKKMDKKGIPLSTAINMFFTKIINNEIDIDFTTKDKDFFAEEIPVTDKKIAKLMDDAGKLYSKKTKRKSK